VTDSFIKAARRAGRRQWILDVLSSRWLRWLPEWIWDRAFDRFVRADEEARRLLEAQILREGGIARVGPLDYRGADRS
jgi:hypothetical protein